MILHSTKIPQIDSRTPQIETTRIPQIDSTIHQEVDTVKIHQGMEVKIPQDITANHHVVLQEEDLLQDHP